MRVRPLSNWDTARVLSGTAVLGCAFVLGLVVARTVQDWITEQRRFLAVSQAAAESFDTVQHLESTIAKTEATLPRLSDEQAAELARRRLANLYERLGEHSQSQGRFTQAEMALQRAATLAPSSPEPHEDLGRLYAEAARNRPVAATQVTLFQSSVDHYREAAQRVADPAERVQLMDQAAQAQIGLARVYQSQGQLDAFRGALEQARKIAPNGLTAAEELRQISP